MDSRILKCSRTGQPFTLPKWTEQTPQIGECASENPSYRDAVLVAPKGNRDGASLIRSLLRLYADRWLNGSSLSAGQLRIV